MGDFLRFTDRDENACRNCDGEMEKLRSQLFSALAHILNIICIRWYFYFRFKRRHLHPKVATNMIVHKIHSICYVQNGSNVYCGRTTTSTYPVIGSVPYNLHLYFMNICMSFHIRFDSISKQNRRFYIIHGTHSRKHSETQQNIFSWSDIEHQIFF